IGLVAWLITQGKQQEAENKKQEDLRSLADVEITYDKFQDETDLTYGSRLPGAGPPYPALVVSASHSGAELTAAATIRPILVNVVTGGTPAPGAVIIFLADGKRFPLARAASPRPGYSCSGTMSLEDLRTVSVASDLEGQAGAFEFRLNRDQKA